MAAVLTVKNLTKIFGKKKPLLAVDGVSFSVSEGEIVGLLGPNGAGKSTTIQMLLGTLKPTSGSIVYFGKDLSAHRSEILSSIGYINGYSRLPWNLSVAENLDIYGRIAGLTSLQRRERIQKLLKLFDGLSFRSKLMGKLSAGQATRVMLVKAFLAYPKMVLLDEPTAALDPDICTEVRSFVQLQRREYGVSMIYTSHNMSEVAEVCDRVIFLKSGRICAVDTPEQLASTGSLTMLRVRVERNVEAVGAVLGALSDAVNIKDNWVEASMEGNMIASALQGLAQRGLPYSDVEVVKPTLEDYFLRISAEQSAAKRK